MKQTSTPGQYTTRDAIRIERMTTELHNELFHCTHEDHRRIVIRHYLTMALTIGFEKAMSELTQTPQIIPLPRADE